MGKGVSLLLQNKNIKFCCQICWLNCILSSSVQMAALNYNFSSFIFFNFLFYFLSLVLFDVWCNSIISLLISLVYQLAVLRKDEGRFKADLISKELKDRPQLGSRRSIGECPFTSNVNLICNEIHHLRRTDKHCSNAQGSYSVCDGFNLVGSASQ